MFEYKDRLFKTLNAPFEILLCATLHALMWYAINTDLSSSLLCLVCIMHIRNTIRFLMVIKQIKNWIKVDSSGLWCNINPMLKHNERQWSNRDITYPEKLTNKCLGQVSWGAKVALMSTLESGLWVTLIQQLDGVVTRENDKQMDELVYLKWAPKNYVNTVEVDLNILWYICTGFSWIFFFVCLYVCLYVSVFFFLVHNVTQAGDAVWQPLCTFFSGCRTLNRRKSQYDRKKKTKFYMTMLEKCEKQGCD